MRAQDNPKLKAHEIKALKAVRDDLMANRLHHYSKHAPMHCDRQPGEKLLPAERCFSMGYVNNEYPCGSICCIGGWTAKALDTNPEMFTSSDGDYWDTRDMPSGLYNLFWQNTNNNTTPAQAAQAITNYLMNGDPQWSDIMGDELTGEF